MGEKSYILLNNFSMNIWSVITSYLPSQEQLENRLICHSISSGVKINIKLKKQSLKLRMRSYEKLIEVLSKSEKYMLLEAELEKARETVRSIKIRSICELKAFRRPPDLFMVCMSGLLLIMEGRRNCTWETAKRFLLGSPISMMLGKIAEHSSILLPKHMKELKEILENPDFTYEKMSCISESCGAIAAWIIAY